MRYRQEYHIPQLKALCISFTFGNERLAENCFLIGNDLETSEVQYSVLFCIKS